MSNTDSAPEAVPLQASVVQAVDVIEARKAAIGDGTEVRRLLPKRELRTIGAWCFLDHNGPDDTSAGEGMRVPPHPHIGLQTGDWGDVHGYPYGDRLAAPPLPPAGLKPR